MTIGAFAVILDDQQRILLCHRRDKDLWNLPGGRVEEGESPWSAATRETREEIGLSISIVRLLGVYYKHVENDLVFMFLASVEGNQQPKTSNEADKTGFYHWSEIPQNTAPKQKERLSALFAGEAPLHPDVVLREQ